MNGTNGKQGSSTLAVVAGGLLLACTIGVKLMSASAAPDPRHHVTTGGTPGATVVAQVPGRHTTSTQPTVARPPAASTPATKPASFGGATGGHGTIPHAAGTVTTPPTPPANPGLGQTYVDPNYHYRLSYPNNWSADDSSSGSFIVTAPDDNASVEVDVQASQPLNATGLQSDLYYWGNNYLNSNFSGGTVIASSPYKATTVDGAPAEVTALKVYCNGVYSLVYVSDVYANGNIYYATDVVDDTSAPSAQLENNQISAIMGTFHLR